jgi:hypothetical protein
MKVTQPITVQRVDRALKSERRARRRLFIALCASLFALGFLAVTCYALWSQSLS